MCFIYIFKKYFLKHKYNASLNIYIHVLKNTIYHTYNNNLKKKLIIILKKKHIKEKLKLKIT